MSYVCKVRVAQCVYIALSGSRSQTSIEQAPFFVLGCEAPSVPGAFGVHGGCVCVVCVCVCAACVVCVCVQGEVCLCVLGVRHRSLCVWCAVDTCRYGVN